MVLRISLSLLFFNIGLIIPFLPRYVSLSMLIFWGLSNAIIFRSIWFLQGDFAALVDLWSVVFNCWFSKMHYFSRFSVLLHVVTSCLTFQCSVTLNSLRFPDSRFSSALTAGPWARHQVSLARLILSPFSMLVILPCAVMCSFWVTAYSSVRDWAECIPPSMSIYHIPYLSSLWHFETA